MKIINRYISTAALTVGALLSVTSCSDDNEPFADESSRTEDVTLTLAVPDFTLDDVASRSVDENAISTVTVVGYNASGVCASTETYTSSDITTSNGTSQLRISLPKGVTRVEVAANASSLITSKPSVALSEIWNSTSLASASNLVFWGKASLSDMLNNNYVVTLTRQTAKFTVANEATSTFTLTGAKISGSAASGSIAPRTDSSGNEQITVKSGETFNSSSSYVAAGVPVYIYETSAGKAHAIIRGTYNGATTYYKVALYSPGTNNPVDLRRNHHYRLTVKSVLGAGYPSETIALSSDVSNNIVTEMRNYDEGIYSLIGTNDYALGVCKDIDVTPTTTAVTAPIILMANNAADFKDYTVTIPSAYSSWIKSATIPTSYTTVNNGTYTTNARAYNVAVTLTANSHSTQPRSGYITVRFRNLERTVKITQKGADFKRDASRRVTLSINGTNVTTDYFSWIDNTVKGIKPENMRNAVRNEGLHFSTETDVNKYIYYIPYLSGDVLKSKGNSEISVVRDGSNWKVTLTAATAATQMWISNFVITNSDNIDIEYPVYRTGIFHNITSTVANTYQVPSERHSGWYYYETVAVKGSDNKTYYILDRNLAAEGNGPFSLATASLADNNNTVGAYYKISNSKSDNIKPTICPTGFTIPSAEDLKNIGFIPGDFHTLTGEEYHCATKATVASSSQIADIFLPTGGYVEGDNYKNSNHANIWSCSYLSGAQGFAEDSPEFKFWFLYLDSYGTKIGLSNMRFINGGGGQMGSVFKGMPVRCIRGNSSSSNSSGGGSSTGGGGGEVTYYTIYWDNSSTNWPAPCVYSYDSGNNATNGAWPGIKMTYVSGSTWKATVKAGDLLVFNNNNGGSQYPGQNQTGWSAVDGHIYGTSGDKGTYSGGTTPTGHVVNWDNKNSTGWGTPRVHYWKEGGATGTEWNSTPEMTHKSGTVYTFTIPAGFDRVIFCSNDRKSQTETLRIVDNATYDYNNQNSYKP